MVRFLFVSLAIACAACAPSLSTFQPAHVAPRGHLQAGAGLDLAFPLGTIVKATDAAKALVDSSRSRELTSEEKLKICDGGVNLATNPPSLGPHLGVAYVPIDNLDVSLRYASSAWRLGTRYQILHRDDSPFDMTAGIGISRFTYEFPVSDQIPVLEIEDFRRWQLDVPILIGTARDWMRVWGGPKFAYTWFDTALSLKLDFVHTTEVAEFHGQGAYVGGQAGFAVGWKYVFAAFELTIAEFFGRAKTTIADGSERTTDLAGLIVHPSAGILAEF